MSLAERIQSRNGEMHRQQIEVLQQHIQEMEEENRYYRTRLQQENERMEEVRSHLAEDWYFVKRELYNFIQLTQAMSAVQAKESSLLKNIVQFDRRVEALLSPQEPAGIQELGAGRAGSPERSRHPGNSVEPSPTDVEGDTLQEILGLW